MKGELLLFMIWTNIRWNIVCNIITSWTNILLTPSDSCLWFGHVPSRAKAPIGHQLSWVTFVISVQKEKEFSRKVYTFWDKCSDLSRSYIWSQKSWYYFLVVFPIGFKISYSYFTTLGQWADNPVLFQLKTELLNPHCDPAVFAPWVFSSYFRLSLRAESRLNFSINPWNGVQKDL